MNVLDRLTSVYDSLSRQQKRVGDYLRRDFKRAAFQTVRELGKAAGVSESTIVRFAYALGYDGYPSLQKELQQNLRMHLTTAERLMMMHGLSSAAIIQTTFETDIRNLLITAHENSPVLIDAAVHAINTARRVYLIGSRSSKPLVEFLEYYLSYILDNVHMVRFDGADVHAQILGMNEDDCVLAVSFPRYSMQTISLLQEIQQKQSTVVTITDHRLSPAALLAEYTLTAKCNMHSFVDSFVAALALINVLIIKLGLKREETLFSNFAQLEKDWRAQGVYAQPDSYLKQDEKWND